MRSQQRWCSSRRSLPALAGGQRSGPAERHTPLHVGSRPGRAGVRRRDPVGLVAAIVILVGLGAAMRRPGLVRRPRSLGATYTLAATVAVVSCLVLLAAVLIIVAGRVLGLYSVGPSANCCSWSPWSSPWRVSWPRRSSPSSPPPPARSSPAGCGAGRTGAAAPARRRVVLLGVAAVVVAASHPAVPHVRRAEPRLRRARQAGHARSGGRGRRPASLPPWSCRRGAAAGPRDVAAHARRSA